MRIVPIRIAILSSALAAAAVIASGCASANVNPRAPRSNTGYVDLYAPTDSGIYWDVQQAAPGSDDFKPVFSELNPVERGMLRLAFAPGHHRLRVALLNHVTTGPVEVEVAVENGKITPVRLIMTEGGPAAVRTTEVSRGVLRAGRAGKTVIVGSNEQIIYGLSAEADPAVAYQPKEEMPYAR